MRRKKYTRNGPEGAGFGLGDGGASGAALGSRGGGSAGFVSGGEAGANLTSSQGPSLAELGYIDFGATLGRLPGAVYLGAKRGFDILLALIALGVFGLVLPILALVIKLDSPGPVFYSQERVGINRRRQRDRFDGPDRRKVLQPGRPFQVLKLRTMASNAEAKGPQWARKNDVRVTRVGRVLRRSRLDEVPQFINVLRGDMSIIGPRPERLVFVRQLEKEIPNYHDRLLVLPGITGLAQVINGYDDSIDSVRRKVELDREYIKKAGFRQDGKILLSTVNVVLKGEGAR